MDRQDVFKAVLCALLCVIFICLLGVLVWNMLGSYLILVVYAFVAAETMRFLQNEIQFFCGKVNPFPEGWRLHSVARVFLEICFVCISVSFSIYFIIMCLKDGYSLIQGMLVFCRSKSQDLGAERFLNSTLHQLNGTLQELQGNYSSHPIYPVVEYLARQTSSLLDGANESDSLIDQIKDFMGELLAGVNPRHLLWEVQNWLSAPSNLDYVQNWLNQHYDWLNQHYESILKYTYLGLFHGLYFCIYWISRVVDVFFFISLTLIFKSSQVLSKMCKFIVEIKDGLDVDATQKHSKTVAQEPPADHAIVDEMSSKQFEARINRILSSAILYPVLTALSRVFCTWAVAFVPELCFAQLITTWFPLPCKLRWFVAFAIVSVQTWMLGFPRPLPFPFLVAILSSFFAASPSLYASTWIVAIPWGVYLCIPGKDTIIVAEVIRAVLLVLGLKSIFGAIDDRILDFIQSKSGSSRKEAWIIPMSVALGIEVFHVHAFVICPLVVSVTLLTLDLFDCFRPQSSQREDEHARSGVDQGSRNEELRTRGFQNETGSPPLRQDRAHSRGDSAGRVIGGFVRSLTRTRTSTEDEQDYIEARHRGRPS